MPTNEENKSKGIRYSFDFDEMVRISYDSKASDIHLIPYAYPQIRVHGDIQQLYGFDKITPSNINDIKGMIFSDKDMRKFEDHGSVDKGYEVKDICRLRVSIAKCLEDTKVVCRLIPNEIPTLQEFKMPKIFQELSLEQTGLIIVGGITGSGKSTTIAAMIEEINNERPAHVITIEDPIEFVHKPNKCIFTRREIGQHVEGFADGLRTCLRQDPDVILVGEMRDLETMRAAMQSAETGHLVFATVHANEVDDIPERIIGSFPDDEQNQIRSQLANVGLAFIAQCLPKRKDGRGRVGAFEILVLNSAARNLIREKKSFQLPSVMQTNRKHGMITMTEYLMHLYENGVVDEASFVRFSTNKQRAREFVLQTHSLDIASPRIGIEIR